MISSTRGSLREVVADAALTIDPENLADLTAALTRLAASGAERDAWRAAGFRNAARFDWARNAEQTLALYARAVQHGKS